MRERGVGEHEMGQPSRPRARASHCPIMPPIDSPQNAKRLHAERIGDRQRVPAQLLDAVFAGRRIAGAVAAQVVAQHLEVPLEIRRPADPTCRGRAPASATA